MTYNTREKKADDLKVLDASSILHSDLDYSNSTYYITNTVLSEIISETAKEMINKGIREGTVKIKDPKIETIKEVKEAAEKTGDLPQLSETDIEVIALALETKAEILTDDYAIQNVASYLKIKHHPTTQDGIKKTYIWEKICPGCGLKHSQNFTVCEICGTKLKKTGRNITEE